MTEEQLDQELLVWLADLGGQQRHDPESPMTAPRPSMPATAMCCCAAGCVTPSPG